MFARMNKVSYLYMNIPPLQDRRALGNVVTELGCIDEWIEGENCCVNSGRKILIEYFEAKKFRMKNIDSVLT